VFVDGCFWHACPDHYVTPKANAEWWAAKLTANRERDHRNDDLLADLGWRTVHIWEHEDPSVAAEALAVEWRESRPDGTQT
jgi:DNA mismatch endonuclease (patch repair protein)